MKRNLSLFLLFLALLSLAIGTETSFATPPQIDVLEAKGIINPVMAGYIERGIREAESHQAVALIIQLDTPGGLDTSMRDIIKSMVESPVPVVVYVSPPGARAASAGVFITMAAHVAAMAPQTTIGAAHPVAIGSSGEVAQLPPEMEEKILNDAVAYIRGLAGHQGRNVDWAEKAVRESVAIGEEEALGLRVIDLTAISLESLKAQLDGKEIIVRQEGREKTITLNTQGAIFSYNKMNFGERFLFTISDPNIAYILLTLGMLAIFLELSNPGAVLPGVAGGISLLLALYSLGTLNAYWGGLLLIVLAFGLFLADLFATSHGMLTAGAIVSLVIGSLLLFSGKSSLFRINPWLIATVAVFFTAFFVFVIGAVVQAHRKQPTTGKEGLAGKTAIAHTALNPKGVVLIEGERWTALAEDGRIEPGEEVIVSRVEGLKLWVRKSKPG